MREVVVFIGPSLEAETAKKILDAEYRPPASRDDIFRAVKEGVKIKKVNWFLMMRLH